MAANRQAKNTSSCKRPQGRKRDKKGRLLFNTTLSHFLSTSDIHFSLYSYLVVSQLSHTHVCPKQENILECKEEPVTFSRKRN